MVFFLPVVEAPGRVKWSHPMRWIMRVSFLYVILITISGTLVQAHASFGQALDQRVTVGMDNEPLKVLFQRLEQQTGLSYAFSIDDPHKVSFPREERTLKETLDLALEGTDYKYEVVHSTILILKSEGEERQQSIVKGSANPEPEFTVTGKVTDAITQQPLPGVNIVIKGTTGGTSTDNEGKYNVGVEGNETLIFTFIGYKTVIAEIGNRSTIDVSLEQDLAVLNEVVVNGGYYETTDRLKTGSIVKITAKDIERQPVTSPLLALQGRVPGLEITPSSGAPGVAPKIRIRGTNSLRQAGLVAPEDEGNYPLYVIDGVPISSTPIQSRATSFTVGGYDPLSTINPADIESIEVLKDGDATAIYGSRGANGVILITTKKSSGATERTNVSIDVYSGIGKIPKMMNLLDRSQYLMMRREALANDALTPSKSYIDLAYWDTTRYTDWQKELIGGTSNIADFKSNISSGTKNTSFSLGGGYHKETLVYPGDFGYERISGQFNINHFSTNQKFRLTFSSSYGLDNNNLFNDGGGMLISALTLPPIAPRIRNTDSSLNWEVFEDNGETYSSWINPLSYLLKKQKTVNRNLITNLNVSYKLAPNVVLSTTAGYTELANKEILQSPQSARPPEERNVAGSAFFNLIARTSWIVEPKINVAKKINEHNIDIVAGATWQKVNTSHNQTSGEGYISDALLGSLTGAQRVTIFTDNLTDYRYTSMFARVGYRWSDKYLLNITGRRDGSSRFGPGNKFGNFGAIGVAWIFSNEDLFKTIPFISFGKIRSSFGITGNDQIGDYKYYNLYTTINGKYGGQVGLTPLALANADFAWEVTNKLEFALEMSLFDNRIGLEGNWYRNRSSNQLVNSPLSGVTGFASVLENFNATVQNSGWETLIRTDILNSDAWTWNVSFNMSFPSTKLVKFDGIEDSPYVDIYKVGQPLSVQWIYKSKGVNNETGEYQFEDKNSDGFINNLDKSVTNVYHKTIYGGLTNRIQFKRFDVSFLLQFSNQQSQLYLRDPSGQPYNQPIDVLRRWQRSGDQTDIQKFSTTAAAYSNFIRLMSSDAFITDASFLRMKTLSITYRLPSELLTKVRAQGASLFVQGQNVFTLTNYKGLDPETGNALPPLRVFTAGIQLKL